MPISKMLKVHIIAHGDRKDNIISILHDLGVVQIESMKEHLESPKWSHILKEEEAVTTSELDHQIAGIRYALDFVSKFETTTENIIQGFFNAKVAVDEEQYKKITENFDFGLIDTCRKLDAKLTVLKNEEANLTSLYEELLPWEPLEIPLEDLETKYTVSTLGIIPLQNLNNLEEVSQANPYVHTAVVNKTNKEIFVMVTCLKSEAEEIFKELRTSEFSPVSFDTLHGFVRDQLKTNLDSVDETKKHIEDMEEKCTKLLEERLPLMVMHDYLSTIKNKGVIKEKFVRTDKTFIIEGWIPRTDVPILQKGLSSIKEIEILTEEPDEGEEPPVELRNTGRLIRPFQLVTNIYGLPRYYEIDPTGVLAPFFIVFFGLCLSDVFYGVLLIALAVGAMKMIKAGPDGRLLFKLMIFAGIVTIVFGFITGSWFGDFTVYFPGKLAFLNTVRENITVINPIESPLDMLAIVLLMGLVHVWIGIFIKMYMSIRDGFYLDALFDQGLWLVLLPFGTLMVLKTMFDVNVPAYTAIKYIVMGCLVGLVLTQGRYQKAGNIVATIFMKFFVGLLSIYNIFGYLGDVLSYSRVLALGLATGAIAIVFNQIISMVWGLPYIGIILAIILFPILHLFNLIINALGAFIHPGRLQYVEFFTKFLEAGGEDFEPFQFDSKYIKINKKGG
jgi:V/A-type H+-transporting ATPase subunit I